MEIKLDNEGVERKSKSWQAYLVAQEEVVESTKTKQDLQLQVWKDKQAILDRESEIDNVEELTKLTDEQRHQKEEAIKQARLAFDLTAEKVKNADSAISAAKVMVQAAYRDYQDVSGTILSPTGGIVNNLTLTPGSILTASTSQSTSTGTNYASSQIIGFIRSSNNEYQAKVSLSEVDAPKVQAGQKVNLTLDAHPGKSFTGKVIAVDVSGVTNSGVSSYPATIALDPTELAIYPNMSVSATIITKIEADVLLIPTSAIVTNEGVESVKVLKNGIEENKIIETGENNGSKTVVISGLNEGDEVVAGSTSSIKNDNSTSAFSNTRQGELRIGGPGF